MAGSLNQIQLIGRLGRDPELKRTNSGTPVADFSLATTEVFNDRSGQRQESTEWHNIVVWNQSAETASRYLRKGALIFFTGKAKTRSWDDQQTGKKVYRTEYHGTFKFLESKQNQNHSGGGSDSFQNNNFGEPPSSGGFPPEPNYSNLPTPYDAPPAGLPVEDELPF